MRNPGWNHRGLTHLQPPRLVAERDVELSVHDDEYLFLLVCMERSLRPWFVSGEADHQAATEQRLENQSPCDVHVGKLGNRHEPARECGVSSVGRRTEVGIRLYPRSVFSVLQDALTLQLPEGSEWQSGAKKPRLTTAWLHPSVRSGVQREQSQWNATPFRSA